MEGLDELRELTLAVSRAAEAVAVIRRKASRHVMDGEPPKRQRVLLTLDIDGRIIELTDKQIAALLTVKASGGAEVLSTVARMTGLTSKLGLGLALQLAEKGLVKLVATPQRKIIALTPLGRKVADIVEREIESRVTP
ncbi:MAG: hypothetical protein QW324_08045 [Thermofilaceae archaeon]